MRRIAEAAGRVLRPLSSLLNTRLKLENGIAADENLSTVAVSGSNLVVRAADSRPFTDTEREFLREMFDLIRLSEQTDARLRTFEDRIGKLEGENLDLLMQNRALSEISARDALTGLYNRWYVMEKIDSEMNRALRHGAPMSLLMVDLDHFKRVNDSFGHMVGDQVLKHVGQVLRESCRVYDVPGRYGGQEVCIILPESRVSGMTVLRRGWRKRCPRCGEGLLFRRGASTFERCSECQLLYRRNHGDTLMFMIITDRIPILFGIAAVYFGFQSASWPVATA